MSRSPQSPAVASGVGLAGAVVAVVANFSVAIAVGLGGAAFAGMFFSTTAIISILGTSAGLGTMTGQVYFMAQVLSADNPNPRSLLMLAVLPVAIISTIVALLVTLLADPAAQLFAPSRADDVGSMLGVLAWTIPPWALSVPLLGATRGFGSMTATVAINQVFKPLAQMVFIGLVFVFNRNPSPVLVAVGWSAPVFMVALAAGFTVWRLGGFTREGPAVVTASQFWKYTRPRSLAVGLNIGLERIDVVLVSAWAGEAAAGVYGAITRFVTAGNFIVHSLGQAVAPTLRQAINSGRFDEARMVLQRTTGWMVLVVAPYFLVVAIKAEPLARLLSPEFVVGAPALSVLAAMMIVNAASGPIDLTLLMMGRSSASLVAVSIAVAVDVVLAWLLIPPFGLVGAAIAWGTAVTVQTGLVSAVVYRTSAMVAPARPMVVAGVGAMLAIIPIGLLTPVSLWGLLATGVVGAGIYGFWLVRHQMVLDIPIGLLARRIASLWR